MASTPRALWLSSNLDATTVLVVAALCTHAIFKKWEPMYIPTVLGLLLGFPAALVSILQYRLDTPQSVPRSFLLFWSTLLLSIVLYRLSPIHPLARYPGPIQAKVSKLWMAWVASSGKQHLYIQRLHDVYGDVVRIGPNELSIRDVSAIQPLMGAQGWPKGPQWSGRTFHTPLPSLIAIRERAAHARRRKVWNRGFNAAALKEYQPIITRRVEQLVEALGNQQGTVDLAQWMSFFTYDFMCDMAFGGGSEMLRDGDTEGLWQNMKDGLDIGQVYEHIPWLSYYTRYIPGVAEELKRFRAFCYQRSEQRFRAGSTTKDLFYYLSNEDGFDKETPSRPLILSEAILTVIAGSDTTSNALTIAFWLLLRHPECYRQLQNEVDRYYPAGEDALDPRHHPKMVYLDAVLNEVLRLYPAVPSGSQRSAELGTEGKLIGPYYIPKGNQARIHFWSVHRDPRNFSYPSRFYPDRWLVAEGLLESEAGSQLIHTPNAYVPFSFGPANCVGKNLALQEMRTVMCQVMQRLSVRFGEGSGDSFEREIEDRLVYKTGRLLVVVERRE
ncbi:cytochrome P450 [Cytidiella melzeri]|nr:cytochrome P450 [Cytidiella melzeri]